MDHSTHTPLTGADLTNMTLVNAPIYDGMDEKVGTISHLHGRQAVIDVGGFLGIGSKPVLIGLDQLSMMRDEFGNVHGVTRWTKDELKDLPEHVD